MIKTFEERLKQSKDSCKRAMKILDDESIARKEDLKGYKAISDEIISLINAGILAEDGETIIDR